MAKRGTRGTKGRRRKPAALVKPKQAVFNFGNQKQSNKDPEDLIIINLMTDPAAPYEGERIFEHVLKLGLRWGGQDPIFHYYDDSDNEEPIFRMADLLKPGYFDIGNMGQFYTHALCFFFELRHGHDNLKTYESMLSIITRLRDELGGELHDENRDVFTNQRSIRYRELIDHFES